MTMIYRRYTLRKMETSKFLIRMDTELKDMLRSQAKDRGLTLTAYVRMILKERVMLEAKKNGTILPMGN